MSLVENLKISGRCGYQRGGISRFKDGTIITEELYLVVEPKRFPLRDSIKVYDDNEGELEISGVTVSGQILIPYNRDLDNKEVMVNYLPDDLLEVKNSRDMYDSKHGINEHVKDLKTLHEILDLRIIAAKSLGHRLNEFFISRSIFLDQFGQSWIIEDLKFAEKEWYNLDRVCTKTEFEFYGPSYTYGTGKFIPDYEDRCPQCGELFSLNELEKISSNWYSSYMFHDGCIGHFYYEHQRSYFEDILKEVYPLEDLKFTGIKSGYNTDKNGHNRPWFKVETPDGLITIGNRKRVISIEWTDYKLFDMRIFRDENTTKWDNGIHAWTTDKAKEYLINAKKAALGVKGFI